MTRHLGLLVWLRAKYLWRSGWGHRIALLLAVGVALLLSMGLALGIGGGLRKLFAEQDPGVAWNFVHLGFALVYVLWLYLGSFSDLYDPARLAPFPIRPGVIFLGSTLGTLLGIAPIFAAGIAIGFGSGCPGGAGAAAARALLMVLLLLHLQMLARALRLAFLSVLTSRRWRDLMILVSTLLGGGIYLSTQFFRRELFGTAGGWLYGLAERGAYAAWTSWTPPGWMAMAYRLEGSGAWTGLGLLAGSTALVGWIGGRLEVRLAFGEPVFGGPAKKAAAVRRPFLAGFTAWLQRAVGPEIAAVARKELLVFWRDPLVRHRLLTGIFYLVIPVAGPLLLRGDSGGPDVLNLKRWVTGSVAYLLLFTELAFLMNQFGLDGTAVRGLLSFPAARWRLVAGKNAAYFAVFGVLNGAAIVAAAAIFGTWNTLALDLAFGLSALAITIGLGSVASVWLPTRFMAPGTRLNRAEADGCGRSIQKALATWAVMLLVAPVAGVRVAVELWLGPGWTWILVPPVLAYGAGLWLLGLKVAARSLEGREERLGDAFRAA